MGSDKLEENVMRLLTDEETQEVCGGKYATYVTGNKAQLVGALGKDQILETSRAMALRALQRNGGKLDLPASYPTD